jgi:glutamate-ammonia-ligase adenylyltransferase
MWDPGFEQIRKTPEEIRSEVIRRAQRVRPDEQKLEELLGMLRRIKNEELLRIGVADLTDELTVPEVAVQLTALAEALLDECLTLAELELRERYGVPSVPPGARGLAVLGLGKLGGQELGYHSDLDLLFVYPGEGDGETAGGSRGTLSAREYYAKLAQRFLAFLQMHLREGRLYAIDARLRPSGNQGMLVVSERAFRLHHESRAQLWERQALIKARGAAGDAVFSQALLSQVRDRLVYQRPLPPSAGQEIHRLRERMEHELSGESDVSYNPKTGRGGLVDVEFATQFLQLREGHRAAELRQTNTLKALEALTQMGHLSRTDAASLSLGYLFLRRTETRLRIIHGESMVRLPTQGRSLQTLARRLGYLGSRGPAQFLDDYRAHREEVRSVYMRILSQ